MNKLKTSPSSVWLAALTALAFLLCWPGSSIKSILPLDPFNLDTSVDFRHSRKGIKSDCNASAALKALNIDLRQSLDFFFLGY